MNEEKKIPTITKNVMDLLENPKYVEEKGTERYKPKKDKLNNMCIENLRKFIREGEFTVYIDGKPVDSKYIEINEL